MHHRLRAGGLGEPRVQRSLCRRPPGRPDRPSGTRGVHHGHVPGTQLGLVQPAHGDREPQRRPAQHDRQVPRGRPHPAEGRVARRLPGQRLARDAQASRPPVGVRQIAVTRQIVTHQIATRRNDTHPPDHQFPPVCRRHRHPPRSPDARMPRVRRTAGQPVDVRCGPAISPPDTPGMPPAGGIPCCR